MDSSELNRLYDFTGKTVVVTGGTGILGGEIACALVGCGANVAILDRNLDPAQHILDLMEPRANQAVAISANVVDLGEPAQSRGDRQRKVWQGRLPAERGRRQQTPRPPPAPSCVSSICPPMLCVGFLT